MKRLMSPALTAALGLSVSVGMLALVGCDEDGPDSVVPGVEALIFVSRAIQPNNDETQPHNVTGGNNQTIDYLRYVPGGALYVLEPPTPDGELRNLTEGFEGVDINGIDLSFDAQQVVFSMRHAGDRHYHIWVANVDGSGEPRQLTFGDHHDVMPTHTAGGRIAFATNQPYTQMGTRADEYNHSRVVTQMATIDAERGDADRRLCSQNLSHSALPFRLADGTIGFSRWEHLERVNDVKLFRMNPDCTNMVAIAGQFNRGFNSTVQVQELPGHPGEFISIGTSRRGTIQGGAMIRIDARSRTSTDPNLYMDVQQASFDNLTPQVPLGEASPPSGVGRYRNPWPLDGENQYLVSWADGDVNERNELAGTAPNFGVYLFNAETQERVLVYDNPNMWDLYAIPVRPTDTPPVIPDTVGANPDPNEPAIIGSVDVTQTSLNENVRGAQFDGTPLSTALQQATRVRIIEGFSSEIGPVGMFGLTMAEGAAILGETPVHDDGSWRAAVPAYLPYHLQPIDRFGLAIRNQTLWIQAMPGETRNCGGCHASRSETVQPRMGTTTIAQQVGADMDTFRTIPERIELPWAGASENNIQDFFNANCVSCHDGGASDPYAGMSYTVEVTTMEGEMYEFEIPYLDLTDRPITTYFDMEVVTYPASYVTLLYPSAMMGETTISAGSLPPEWVRPSNARGSELVRALNMNSETDENEWAYEGMAHPNDQGVTTVTRADRLMIIRMADLGGQFYSRRNVEGADAWGEVEGYED